MVSHEEMLQYCVNLKITANQFNFCYLIYTKDWTNLKRYSETSFINSSGDKRLLSLTASELKDLVDRSYIIELFEGERTNQSVMVTEKFTKLLFVNDEDSWDELWETYFDTFIIDGIHQSAKSTDKDELGQKYLRIIRRSIKKHQAVMKDIEDYKTLVTTRKMKAMGIEKFITGRNWEVVRKIMEETVQSWDDSL